MIGGGYKMHLQRELGAATAASNFLLALCSIALAKKLILGRLADARAKITVLKYSYVDIDAALNC